MTDAEFEAFQQRHNKTADFALMQQGIVLPIMKWALHLPEERVLFFTVNPDEQLDNVVTELMQNWSIRPEHIEAIVPVESIDSHKEVTASRIDESMNRLRGQGFNL